METRDAAAEGVKGAGSELGTATGAPRVTWIALVEGAAVAGVGVGVALTCD